MALLQALIAFLTRSLGRIVNAIFGWAVTALFGRTDPKQQVALSVLVAAAAASPVLLVGILFPQEIAFILTLVPMARRAPASAVRIVWIVLALAVPVALGIASAFLLMFVTVPALRIASMVRRRRDQHMPLITDGPNLAYWRGRDLELAHYPGDLLVRGTEAMNVRAHGLFAEALVHTPGLMTFDAAAQDLEREIRQIWQVYDENPAAHRDSRMLLARLDDVRDELWRLNVTSTNGRWSTGRRCSSSAPCAACRSSSRRRLPRRRR